MRNHRTISPSHLTGRFQKIFTVRCSAAIETARELWARCNENRRREPVFITKSKTDSSPFPVRPACLAEHISWRNNVDAVCLGNNGPKQYPIPPRCADMDTDHHSAFHAPVTLFSLSIDERISPGTSEDANGQQRSFLTLVSTVVFRFWFIPDTWNVFAKTSASDSSASRWKSLFRFSATREHQAMGENVSRIYLLSFPEIAYQYISFSEWKHTVYVFAFVIRGTVRMECFGESGRQRRRFLIRGRLYSDLLSLQKIESIGFKSQIDQQSVTQF